LTKRRRAGSTHVADVNGRRQKERTQADSAATREATIVFMPTCPLAKTSGEPL
jgi:hypothetical protein